MIEFFSSWAKGIGITVVIISIFEMVLPNNNSKKYIRMVLGIYLLFNIISPLISNKQLLDVNNINLEELTETTYTQVDQTSMNSRIKKTYEQELEKDITKKLKEKGYEVSICDVTTQIATKEDEETKINKIKIKANKTSESNEDQNKDTESKIVTEIQKIKKVEPNVNVKENSEREDNNEGKSNEKSKINSIDIQNIKKFLIEEYGVNEKCLEIS